MKKTLLAILVMAMVMSVITAIPSVSAEEVYTYNFTSTENGGVKGVLAPVFADYAEGRNWKYVAMEDSFYTAYTSHSDYTSNPDAGYSRYARTMTYGLQLQSANNQWLALGLKVPTKGTYRVDLTYATLQYGKTGDIYVAPLSVGAEGAIAEQYKLGSVNYNGTGEASTAELGTLAVTSDNEEVVVVFKSTGGNMAPQEVRLTYVGKVMPKQTYSFVLGSSEQNKGITNYSTYDSTGKNWRYYGMSDSLYAKYETNFAYARTLYYGVQIQAAADEYVQFAVNVPDAGVYKFDIKFWATPVCAKTTSLYFAPASSENKMSADKELEGVSMRGDVSAGAEGSAFAGTVNVPSPGEYVITMKSSAGAMQPREITLTGVEPTGITAETESKTIKLGGKSAITVKSVVDGINYILANHGADFNDSNNCVTIGSDGTITAKAEGETVISVSAVGFNTSIPITVYHPNAKIDEATTSKLYISAPEGAEIDGAGIVSDVAIGTARTVTAPEKIGELEFKYWKDIITGRVLSTDAEYSFTVGSNTKIEAVYAEKANGYLVEFANANGEVISSSYKNTGDAITAPALPSLTGFGMAREWSRYPSVVGTSNVQSVAIYDDPAANISITVENGSGSGNYAYNDKVTVTASDGNFSYWKRGEQIVSFDSTYSFYAWDSATLTAVFGEDVSDVDPSVILDDSVRTENGRFAYMSELVGFDGKTVIEHGIIFGSEGLDIDHCQYKAVAKGTSGQFSSYTESSLKARAYAIYRDGADIRIAYSAEK